MSSSPISRLFRTRLGPQPLPHLFLTCSKHSSLVHQVPGFHVCNQCRRQTSLCIFTTSSPHIKIPTNIFACLFLRFWCFSIDAWPFYVDIYIHADGYLISYCRVQRRATKTGVSLRWLPPMFPCESGLLRGNLLVPGFVCI